MDQIDSETVDFQGAKYTAIQEGLASILTPFKEPSDDTVVHRTSKNNNNNTGLQTVFYNKIQQFNRDLTILAILVHGEGALVEKREKGKRKHKDKKRHKERNAEAKQAVSTAQEAQDIEAAPVQEINGSRDSLKHLDTSNKRKFDEGTGDEVNGLKDDEEASSRKKPRIEEASKPPNERPDEPPIQNPDSKQDESTQVRGGAFDGTKPQASYTILDALSATGLRALRYAKEIPFATQIVANDLHPEAVRAIQRNVEYNRVEHKVFANKDDARALMYGKSGSEPSFHHGPTNVRKFDVVDLDPYGTASPFFDAAVQSVQDGGLLCVTCTDAGVFASNGYPEKAYVLYAGTTMKGYHSHEAGLRLILHAISLSAAKYGIAIEPLLCLSIDFYARLFVRIHKRPHEAKLLSGTSMITYNCDQGCGAWSIQKIGRNTPKQARNGERYFHYSYAQGPSVSPKCEHCGFKTHLAGPMWAGPLYNPFFIRAILAKLPSLDRKVYGTVDRLEGMLKTALEEIPPTEVNTTDQVDGAQDKGGVEVASSQAIPRLPPEAEDPMPFFFNPGYVCRVLHANTPSEALLKSAFISLGYTITRSHCKPGSFKTNASWSVIWEIVREWVRQRSPLREGALKPGTAGYEIMRRSRERDTAKVLSYKEELIQRLDKVSDVDALRSEMEAAMFRLKDVNSDAASNMPSKEDLEDGHDRETDIKEKKISDLKIIFDEKLVKQSKEKLVRYQMNMPHWGPMNRATGKR